MLGIFIILECVLKIIMFKAKKSLGQNFLNNPRILDKIIDAAELSKNEVVLEVGPGTGNLTKKLAEKAGRVLTIEKDHRLIEGLKENLKDYKNTEIIEGDVLKLNIRDSKFKVLNSGYKVIANIPYYITSNFLRQVSEEWPRPELIVLMIQKEVAQRIVAKPPQMNLLALSVQYYSIPKIITYVSKKNFKPMPKVDSAIIRLEPKKEIGDGELASRLFKLMRTGFSQKRKQLAPILSKKLGISANKVTESMEKLDLDHRSRAENLSLDQWQKLEKSLFT